MKIKSQERIMKAVKAVLDAEVAYVTYVGPNIYYSKRKVSAETLKRRRAEVIAKKTELLDALESARADLRRAHTEIVHEEYGS